MKASQPSPTLLTQPPAAPRAGFTLIEFVAVLAILSIGAAFVASSMVGRLKRATRQSDAISITTMTDAVRTRVLRTQVIPSAAEIPQTIADELSLPLSRVQASLAGFQRVFLSDPSLQIGSPTGTVFSLPYQQSVRGSIQPASARILMISSLASPIPVSAPASLATFTSLWSHAAGTIPSSWTSWRGDAEDLRMGRLDLRGLFHRVVFNNLDPINAATYSLGATTNSLTLAVGQRLEAYLLTDSALNLHLADSSVQAREFLRADTSYIFENGRWSRDITYGAGPPLGTFGQLVANFLDSEPAESARFGASPQAVIEEFFTYLYTYGMWAAGKPPDFLPFETGGSTSEQQIPQFRSLKDSQARLDSFAGNLID